MSERLLPIGLTGSAFAALCCATPLLPAGLGALGLGGLVGYVYRDAVLLPLLGFFIDLTVVAMVRRRRAE